MNAPTIETAKFGDVYKTKWDVSHTVGYGEIMDMADWIEEELQKFSVEVEKNENKKEKSYKELAKGK